MPGSLPTSSLKRATCTGRAAFPAFQMPSRRKDGLAACVNLPDEAGEAGCMGSSLTSAFKVSSAAGLFVRTVLRATWRAEWG